MALPLMTPPQELHRGTIEVALGELQAIMDDTSCWREDFYDGQPNEKVIIATRAGEDRVRVFWERMSAVLHRE